MDIDPKDVIARLLIDHTDPDLISALHSFWKRHNLLQKEQVIVYQVIITNDEDSDPYIVLNTLDEDDARRCFKDNIVETLENYNTHLLDASSPERSIDGYPRDGLYATNDFDPENSCEWVGESCGIYLKSFTLDI